MPALDEHGKEMDDVKDEQTGRRFKVVHEKRIDRIAARTSFAYLLVVAGALVWALIKTWLDQPPLLSAIFGDQYGERFKSPLFHLVSYAAIDGGLGGVASGIRSVIYWHLELEAFGARFIFRDIAHPWLGALLALIVYALVRAGFTVLSGNISQTDTGAVQALWAFSIGTLVGYGSHRVFVWLDDLVVKIFKTQR